MRFCLFKRGGLALLNEFCFTGVEVGEPLLCFFKFG